MTLVTLPANMPGEDGSADYEGVTFDDLISTSDSDSDDDEEKK